MVVTTKAIILSSVKYGDADLIAKAYTEHGVRSYLLKRILQSKKGKLKPAYFQPLTQLELVANHNHKGNLNYIKEAKVLHPYESLNTNIVKQTIAIFLSELLSKTLREEEANPQLYTFLETALRWLDTHDEVTNFHLLFLVRLSKHLGCYPDKVNIAYDFFNLQEGCFTKSRPAEPHISGKILTHFKQLLGINFDALSTLRFSGVERHEILEMLLLYFELHLPLFSKPRSLTILKSIFA